MSWELLVFQSCGTDCILSLHSKTIDCILRYFPWPLSWMFTKLHRETWRRPPRPSIFKTYLNTSKLSSLLETVWSLKFLFSTQRHFQIIAGVCFLYYNLKIPDREWVHYSGPPYIVLVSWSSLLFAVWFPNSLKQFSHTFTSLKQGTTPLLNTSSPLGSRSRSIEV